MNNKGIEDFNKVRSTIKYNGITRDSPFQVSVCIYKHWLYTVPQRKSHIQLTKYSPDPLTTPILTISKFRQSPPNTLGQGANKNKVTN